MGTARRPRVHPPSALERRWYALRSLEARVAERAERALRAAHGLSLSEYMALAALDQSDDDGHLRQQVLADAIALNQSSVSRLVTRLERAGLTERYLCESDRRGIYTQITGQGRTKAAAARTTFMEALTAALDDAQDDNELAPLIPYLRR